MAGLLACARGELFGPGNAQLPLPPMLMFDRITTITENGGDAGKGEVVAEFDVNPNLWFFKCHFQGDPVMPGCLGLDALWQMVGFFLGWMGGLGKGRALGVGEVKFTGMVLPTAKKITYYRRSQARDHAQAGAGHRRRHHEGRRQGDLRSQGSAVGLFTDAAGGLLAQSGIARHPRFRSEIVCRGYVHETRRRHRPGHRLVHRQQCPGSDRVLREAKSGIVTAEDYGGWASAARCMAA